MNQEVSVVFVHPETLEIAHVEPACKLSSIAPRMDGTAVAFVELPSHQGDYLVLGTRQFLELNRPFGKTFDLIVMAESTDQIRWTNLIEPFPYRKPTVHLKRYLNRHRRRFDVEYDMKLQEQEKNE